MTPSSARGFVASRLQSSYAQLRVGNRPSALLIDAFHSLRVNNGRALDIGAGPLNDSRWLLKMGFSVDAVDPDPVTFALGTSWKESRLTVIPADIRDVSIAPASYSVVVAIHVLPFLGRADLSRTMSGIIHGLCVGGVLCCTFLGCEDSWAVQRRPMTFLERWEIQELTSRLHPLRFSEHNYAGWDAENRPKRWHVFRCISRK